MLVYDIILSLVANQTACATRNYKSTEILVDSTQSLSSDVPTQSLTLLRLENLFLTRIKIC